MTHRHLNLLLRRHICAAILLVSTVMLLSPVPLEAQVFRSYGGGSIQIPQNDRKKRQSIKGFHRDGTLKYEAQFKRGKLHGSVVEYYESGILKAEVAYKDNQRDGTARYYYPSGILMAKIRYRNNHEIGMSEMYNEQGVLTGKVSFRRKIREQIENSALNDTLRDSLTTP